MLLSQVLEQIAQDRAERKAREEKERLERERGTASVAAATVASPPIVNCNQANYNQTRIQFKLPDGSTKVQAFEADANFIEAYNFIIENANVQTFTLSQSELMRTTLRHY